MTAPIGHLPPPAEAASSSPDAIRQHTREVSRAVRGVMQGGINNVASFACTPRVTSTMFVDSRLSAQGAVVFDPLTVAAAAELRAGTIYVLEADRSKGVYRVTHGDGPVSADRRFRVIIIG